jgi:hypothetical protein
MNSPKTSRRMMGTACVLLSAALLIIPRYAAGQNKTSKPAQQAPAPAKAQSAPAAPAPAVRPAQQAQPRPAPAAPARPAAQAPARAVPPGPKPPPPRPPFGDPGLRVPTPRVPTPPIDHSKGPGGPGYRERPGETKTPLPGGGVAHHDPRTNTTVHTDPNGRVTGVERPGTVATGFRPDGRAGHIEHARADGSRMVVDRGVRGERRVEVVRQDGARVVVAGRRGFVERSVRAGYVSRTYVIGGRTQVFVYRSYAYRGTPYYRYVPRIHYAPAFYGWAYRPWGARVAYAWGWGPAPGWFYGGYFAPSPYYQDPAFWLTDYLLAENLRLAYENQQAAGAPPPAFAGASTPEQMQMMKQMIEPEVQQQIQADQAAASQPASEQSLPATPTEAAPPALDANQRTFVVSASLDVTANGEGCALTGGDIIYRSGELGSDGKVGVTVLSSKPGDCKANSGAAVELAALQEMQNQFREQIAGGMETLAAKQGQGGIPTGPAANPTQVAEGQAAPAPDAQTVLAQLNREADQTETEMRQAAGSAAPAAMLMPRVFRCGTPLLLGRAAGPTPLHYPWRGAGFSVAVPRRENAAE